MHSSSFSDVIKSWNTFNVAARISSRQDATLVCQRAAWLLAHFQMKTYIVSYLSVSVRYIRISFSVSTYIIRNLVTIHWYRFTNTFHQVWQHCRPHKNGIFFQKEQKKIAFLAPTSSSSVFFFSCFGNVIPPCSCSIFFLCGILLLAASWWVTFPFFSFFPLPLSCAMEIGGGEKVV